VIFFRVSPFAPGPAAQTITLPSLRLFTRSAGPSQSSVGMPSVIKNTSGR
jgi:hypothetical protein